MARFDHVFNDKHRVFLRLNYDFWEEDKNRFYETPIQGVVLNRINRGLALDDVVMLTPNLVLNVRYGISHQDFTERRITSGADLTELGFSPALTRLLRPGRSTLPRVTVTSYSNFSTWESGDGAANSLNHNLNATLSTQRGIHSLRWGGDFRVYRVFTDRFPMEASPHFTFTNTYTKGPKSSSGGSSIGQDMASMLMGIASKGEMETNASFAIQTVYLAGFVQDDIKLTRSLTLNLGLRYELEWPMTERFNRLVTGFDFDVPSPIEEAARAAYARSPIPEIPVADFRVRGGVLFSGQTPTGRSMFYMDKNNFMPRIGLAWQALRWMTVRAGYGIYYDSLGIKKTIPRQYGYSQSTPLIATVDDGQTYTALVSNPFPDGLIPPVGPAGGLSTYLGDDVTFDNPLKRQAYSQRWSFGLHKLLPGQITLETSYVGNRGTHLNITRDMNATPQQYLSKSLVRDQETITYMTKSFKSPFQGLAPALTAANMSRANLLRPYPQFNTLKMTDSDGYNWYHSLQLRGSRRWRKGLSLNAGYVFSKTMQAITFLNASDTMPYESLSPSHRPHRLTFNAIWELPFGRGRAFGKDLHGFLEGLLGNWQMSAVVVRQAGGPLSWGNIIFSGNPDDIPLPKSQRDVDRWFNVDAGFNRSQNEALAQNVRFFPVADYRNAEIRYTSIPFAYEDPNSPKMVALRRKYKLDEVVAGARTELEKMVKLRNWVAHQWRFTAPAENYPAWDADEILTRKYGVCVQYAITFMQCATALGHQARFVFGNHRGAVDGGGHEVSEWWSNEYGKWVFFDINQNWFYLNPKTGVPYSLLEIHDAMIREYYDGGFAEWTKRPRAAKYSPEFAMCYGDSVVPNAPPRNRHAWHIKDGLYRVPSRWLNLRYMPRNNFLSQPRPVPMLQGLHWDWSDYVIYEDAQTPKEWRYRHFTSRRSDIAWTINQVRFDATWGTAPGTVEVQMGTSTPYFETFLVKVDGEWTRSGRIWKWKLKPGANRLEMRVRNTSGIDGPTSHLEVEYRP